MIRATIILSILALGAGELLAAPPSRPSQARYTKLHRDSPFTSKPISQGTVVYALVGFQGFHRPKPGDEFSEFAEAVVKPFVVESFIGI